MDLTNREREIVFVGASPGEILAHHPLVWHMTPPNTSTRQRRAYTINWITPDVVWESSHAPHPFNYYVRMTEGEAIQGEMFPHFRSRDGDQLGGDDPVEGG